MAGQRLAPGAIARELFTLGLDRDERAGQLCAETLLTLVTNKYTAPASAEKLESPKKRNFALRTLALGENFLSGYQEGRAGDDQTSPAGYGDKLARGEDLRGSANLDLARETLQGLVDPDTQRGQPGGWLLRPFHESLLWYDARPAPGQGGWGVRKVHMRGNGITLARLLLEPADPAHVDLGRAAVAQIQATLTAASPLQRVHETLESAVSGVQDYGRPVALELDEEDAWELGHHAALGPLTARLCRHAEGVMGQAGASGPAKMWQLRTVLALDLATHALRTAWDATATPPAERFLLLRFGQAPRAQDPVRQRSEESWRRTRIRLADATVATLAVAMHRLATVERLTSFDGEFIDRQGLRGLIGPDPQSLSSQLAVMRRDATVADFLPLARTAFENADYNRAGDGARVLMESAGAVAGGTRYPYLTTSPDLLATLVGALSREMPMSSSEFFARVREEWGFVVDQRSAVATTLAGQLDGASLARNARHAERLLAEAGLALGLSDRTTVVGERAARGQR